MKRWNLKNEVEFLANLNPFGLEFFNQENVFNIIASEIGVNPIELENIKSEGIFVIQNELIDKNSDNVQVQIEIVKRIAPQLLLYLIMYDECKRIPYKIKNRRGFIELNGKYCPLLLKLNGAIDFRSLRYIFYNLEGLLKGYWDLYSAYGSNANNKRLNEFLETDYETYSDIKIITC